MTPEELIAETKDSIEFNTKKVEILDKDIEKIKKLQNDRNIIVGQIIKDQGGVEKLEKLINTNNKVESN